MLVKTHHRLTQIGQRLLVAGPLAVIVSLSNVGVEPSHAAINTSSVGQGFTVTAADLAYILKQIKIAEYHVANTTSETGPCGALLGQGPNQVPTPLLSFGLRTVDGSCNNLQDGQETYGASHQAFPRLTKPVFKGAENTTFDPDGDGPQNAGDATAYSQTSGAVFDSEPRTISNLIVDQTSTNPAAVQVAANPFRTQANPDIVEPCKTDPNTGADLVPAEPVGCVPQYQTLFIPNITTDVGLSPPFNSLFTIFGQFFDHGLDKITNGGTGDVFIPLKDDDPMVAGPDHRVGTNCGTADASPECADNLPPQQRFMIPLSRGTIMTGPDGFRSAPNTDTPFVDQSQTYTSHPSHQVFTREYNIPEGTNLPPVATGKFLSESDGGLPTWKTVKAQAENKLGLKLTDTDVHNIPQIAVDAYGNFIPGPARGLPQYVTPNGLVEGCRPTDACVDGNNNILVGPVPVPNNVIRIGAAFLNDIAHSADPGKIGAPKTPDNDDPPTAGSSLAQVASGQYDDELLDLHFICGDGRCNENIALTAVHQVFHSEHDRLIDYFTNPVNGVLTQNPDLLAQFQAVNLLSGPDKTFTYGERLFQAARFVTEMEYQHLVFEEFARKVQPAINPFEPFAFNQTDVNPAITAEFAHAVYRFGHSMLTDKIPRVNSAKSVEAGAPLRNDIPLFDGFLNPAAFKDGGKDVNGNNVILSASEATGAILMGLSDQTGNEIDEFVTEALRNHLLGLPLDLPSINMARARSEGIPSLNNVRKQIYAATNDGQLKPYANWVDFDQNLKHHESLVNFIAAYGKHPTIVNAQTLAGKRAAANEIVNGTTVADAADFMFSTGDWANVNGVSKTGVDDIDLWMGGLAENTNLFGGLLGSTFNYVFEKQLTDLQNGDRFYYLARTPGMNLRTQLEGNSFAELVMRNTPSHTLKADPFATADCKFELGNLTFPAIVPTIDENGVPSNLNKIFGPGSVNDDPTTECNENLLLLHEPDGTFRYRAVNDVDPPGINGQSVYNGTDFADDFYGGNDNDTFWGGLGDDTIDGGGGDDVSIGGEGDDVITDFAGNDILKGGPGNDAMDGGIGDDILMGADGKDFTNGGANINETFGGPDDDFAIAGQGTDAVFGDSGDDWEEGNDQPDLLIGDSSTLFFDDHNLPGHDILIGQGGDDDYDMEGGDDIGVAGPGVEKVAGAAGYDWEIGLGDPQPQNADLALVIVNAPPVNETRDRYNEVEALSGWKFNDILRGDSIVPSQVGGGGFIGCDALDANGVARISGLDALVPESIRTVPAAQVVANSVSHYCQLTGLVWGEGNILLGGEGSDQLEGRGANDILDGDRYLSVRLSVRNGADDINGVDTVRDGTGAEIGSTGLMTTAAFTGSFGTGTTGMTLQEAVFARKVNPGNIVAVREILTPNVPVADCGAASPLNCDTAVFSGPQANYTITPNADGSLTVTDNGGGLVDDGSDTLWNIEQLSFCDVPDPAVRGGCSARAAPVPVGPGATLSASSLAFGNQVVGTTSTLRNITISNTGITTLNVSGVTLNGANAAEFSVTNGCTTVLPNSTCTIRVAFSPLSTGTKTATVSIAHNAVGSPSSVSVSGTGTVGVPAIALSSTSLSFGNQVVGTTSTARTVTVRNTGTVNLIVSSVTVGGANPGQFLGTNNCSTVVPNGTCTISVTFSPLTTGTKTASISITHNAAGSPTAVSVSGTGVATTTATIVGRRIGPVEGVAIGTSATAPVTVRNTGTARLRITSANIAAPFSIVNLGTCDDNVNGVAVGNSCTIRVRFTPTAVGLFSATMSIVSNASNNPTATITGRGR